MTTKNQKKFYLSIDIKLNLIYDYNTNRKGGNTMDDNKLRISLAAARVNAGLSQDDVAKTLNVGKQTIVSWEKGTSEPKISQALRLSDIYHMPIDNIFFT